MRYMKTKSEEEEDEQEEERHLIPLLVVKDVH